VVAVHQHFRFHNWHQAHFLTQGRITRQSMAVGSMLRRLRLVFSKRQCLAGRILKIV
jgi:hypothetical protein